MSYELTIEPLGQTIAIEDGQTILDAALRAGIYLPHACCHGLCATCKVQVVDGEVEHGEASSFALMDFEREEQKCLACCATVQSDLVIEAEIEEDPDAENLPVRDFAGVVSRIESLTPTIKGLWIKLDDPAGMHFQAGQYVNLELPDGIGSRAFSVASPPSAAGEVELNIRIVPGGQGTTYVHERMQVGDPIRISGPYGRFFVKKSAQMPVLFMAGGSGLSSPRSMILDLLGEGFDLPITLVYGQRNRDELYYHDDFLALAERYPNFTYVPVLSHEPAGSDWQGFRGFVHEAAKA
ncbi:MAG: 2Fe-2S iron-sulfur cluster binding domain-containing protein, partial [Betaproteobacteria bacterium]|nr:2Fe-2S iron-sulfur cluster binding domain-containing protein [Betaproteobacteria bacterium]